MTLNNMSNFPTYNILSGAQHLNNGKGIHDVQISDYWLEKGDYMNFEYASLGYTFTKDMLKEIHQQHSPVVVGQQYL